MSKGGSSIDSVRDGAPAKLHQLVTNTHDQPIPGMVRSDLGLLERRVLPDGCLRIHEGVYVHSYADIYRPTN